MIIGRFESISEENKGKTYVLVSCEDKNFAIREANKLFKIKTDKLDARIAYMDDLDGDKFWFEEFDNQVPVWAVFRK